MLGILLKFAFVPGDLVLVGLFIHSPSLLQPSLEFRPTGSDDTRRGLFFAGQITGVEGYMGNAATGLLAGINAARQLKGEPLWVLPRNTMLGALCWYVTHAASASFQPMKANMGILPQLEDAPRKKRERLKRYSERALTELRNFLAAERS